VHCLAQCLMDLANHTVSVYVPCQAVSRDRQTLQRSSRAGQGYQPGDLLAPRLRGEPPAVESPTSQSGPPAEKPGQTQIGQCHGILAIRYDATSQASPAGSWCATNQILPKLGSPA